MTSPVVTSAARAIRASAVRTWTPMLLALVVHVAAIAKIDIVDNELVKNAIAVMIDSVIGVVFYVIVRCLELFKSSKWGKWLLGLGLIKTAPLYVKPAEVMTNVQGDPLP